MNLIEPLALGPGAAFDAVRATAGSTGAVVEGAELVGLVPDAVLRAVPSTRWAQLDLAVERTIESRLGSREGG
jgi:hypothetical protein